ncbi:MAG: VWA domain-containing protein [Spirochaetales bacterium]|nr:VWA domain-containing protein [Spirochaetales bacterium]
MIQFDAPAAFLLLLLIPVMLFFHLRKKKPAGLKYSSVQNIKKINISLKQRLSFIPLVLRIIALVFFTVALARPQEGKELVRDISKGVAMEMVVDRSSSMSLQKDFPQGTQTRLDIVKKAFKEFVQGNGFDLTGRTDDLIGMVIFARYADTICPLTLSHGALLSFIDSVKIVQIQEEDGTSIGDALALACARLKTAEESMAKQTKEDKSNYEIKSKIVILLSDGQDTGIGKKSPDEAIELARKWRIKVYTIGISGNGWYIIQDDPFWGRSKRPAPSQFDTSLMKKIARETGGLFREASDPESLKSVYKEIDELEKSEIESVRYLDYKELFMLYAVLGLAVLLLEIALSSTVFRRIP